MDEYLSDSDSGSDVNDNDDVDMGEDYISYRHAKTSALATCLGLLLDGSIGDREFCFLSHSPKIEEFDDDILENLLAHLIKELSENLKQHLKIDSLSEEKLVNNVKLLVVGGAVDEHILTRKAFYLLNKNINLNVTQQKLNNDKDSNYLFEKLKNSVKIIPAVTFVLSDQDEDRGE
ncbi:unnamed protein product [Rotaria sordida]|uniref:Uncharacterized protein n=1 Tax=Rotaria sordida TaxID=392033 RepID=A0A820AIP6_9BILA|nr:unnamed protein product [Rotaria sordida]CAF0957914.1 unnamed protein product [Rotaria sordida]CAF1036864.1 unnamed protein product [Rotaria sordida]CAF1041410.1 unnamed protein product [Rotaria sordida]CAF4178294.1 unnamed protein product [Rotaria sordida]